MQMKDIINRLDVDKRQKLGEIVRFGIVGVAATVVQYVVYWILIQFNPITQHPTPNSQEGASDNHLWPTIAMTLGYAISFVFNFYASTHFTFRVKANARRGAGFAFSHLVNYLLQMVVLNFFLWLGLSKTIAPLPMFCICVPVNFLLVRFFLKR